MLGLGFRWADMAQNEVSAVLDPNQEDRDIHDAPKGPHRVDMASAGHDDMDVAVERLFKLLEIAHGTALNIDTSLIGMANRPSIWLISHGPQEGRHSRLRGWSPSKSSLQMCAVYAKSAN